MEVIRGDCAPDVGGPVGVDGDKAPRDAAQPILLIEPGANAVDPTSPASGMSTGSGRTTPVPATAFDSVRIHPESDLDRFRGQALRAGVRPRVVVAEGTPRARPNERPIRASVKGNEHRWPRWPQHPSAICRRFSPLPKPHKGFGHSGLDPGRRCGGSSPREFRDTPALFGWDRLDDSSDLEAIRRVFQTLRAKKLL